MGWIYDAKRNVRYEESKEQEEERIRRARIGMKMAEKKALAEQEDKRKRGYCARCGLLLPLNGVCECGCKERRKPHIPPALPRNEIIDHKRGLVKGGYVHPAILAMYNK